MGLDITVLIVEWSRIQEVLPDKRYDRLVEAVDDAMSDELFPGWQSGVLDQPGTAWYAGYEFHDTLGSYKPHFWAGEAWDDIRDFVDPATRSMVDEFLGWLGLGWEGHLQDHIAGKELVPAPASLLVECPPDGVRAMARLWDGLVPRLDDLKEPFDTHAAAPGRWCGTFDEFARLLTEWGEVVREANRLGWGIVGLPI